MNIEVDILEMGQEAWMLDTGPDGEDDILIGTKEEVEADILHFYEMEELPKHWTLERIGGER